MKLQNSPPFFPWPPCFYKDLPHLLISLRVPWQWMKQGHLLKFHFIKLNKMHSGKKTNGKIKQALKTGKESTCGGLGFET